jgi:hypothetical protein
VLFGRMTVRESIDVSAAPQAAWDLIADIRRIGEFSPECVETRWLDGAEGPLVGARFEGTNHVVEGDDEGIWIRPCTIVVAERGARFSYEVGDRYDGTVASYWDFEVEPIDQRRSRIVQTFRHDPDGLSGTRAWADEDPENAEEIVRNRAEGLSFGMRQTLTRMKARLEGHEPAQGAALPHSTD